MATFKKKKWTCLWGEIRHCAIPQFIIYVSDSVQRGFFFRRLGQNWRENKVYLGGDVHGGYALQVNRYTLTTFNDENIPELVKDLSENLAGLLRISVDAYYSTVSDYTTINDEGETVVEKQYSIIYPNTWGSVNTQEMLRDQNDLDMMMSELSPDAFADKLVKNTFRRRDVYRESNVSLHRILAFQLIVNTYPPSWMSK